MHLKHKHTEALREINTCLFLSNYILLHLTFQPVTLKVFPALPIVIVLSHIPGKVAKQEREKKRVK